MFTAIGVVAMLAPGLFVWGQFISVPVNSSIVEAVGQQWHWSYRLPGKDGILGKSAVHLITQENPFGLVPDDINGQDDLLVNSPVLHLPINITQKVLLRSKDVLHNFAVPQFRVKMDLVPGEVTYVWFTPTKLGKFELLCEELCGIAHFTMRGHIIVESKKEHLAWQKSLPTFAESLVIKTQDIATGKTLYQGCAGCHGHQGQGIKAMNAPKLAGLSKWYLTRQLSYFKDRVRGQEPGDKYGAEMANMSALLPNKKSIKEVSAYLHSLADPPKIIRHTRTNLTKGKQLFSNCAYCHGAQGQGNYAMNAPKLSGQHDWYLKRQLANYRQGIRGKHANDLYGSQMKLMANTLRNKQDINHLLNYINSLPN
jgi:cytochrome c oxidase subunit 2